MKLGKRIQQTLFLSLSTLPIVLLPYGALADELPQPPRPRALTGVWKIHETIEITLEGFRPERFFEQYILVRTRSIDLEALLEEFEWQRRLESGLKGLEELAKYFTVPLDEVDWKREHIGIATRF